MPELPEVETVVRQLTPAVVGRILQHIEILDEKLFPNPSPILAGRTVEDVVRVGKTIVFVFSERKAEDRFLGVHLRMTGRLLLAPEASDVKSQRVRAWLRFEGCNVAFADTRRFGTMRLASSKCAFETGGIDPLHEKFTAKRLGKLLENSGQPIKTWLLRQDRLVGLGNIYASEILFASGIDPFKAAGDLSQEEIASIFKQMRHILRKAIRFCGTTFSDFQNARGEGGSFQNFLKVYGHEGDACVICGKPIRRVVQQQRSTYFCPHCQR